MHKFLIPLFVLSLLLVGCSHESSMPTRDTGGSDELIGFDGKLLKGSHTVVLHTSAGDITIELDADAAPKTVTNFVVLAQTGYYDELTFHRVIPGFMIQGGDPNGNGTGGRSVFGETFEDEINAESYDLHKKNLREEVGDQALPPELEGASVMDYYELQGYQYTKKLKSLPMAKGALAMANRGPNTNGSQFFIVQAEGGTPWLEGKHTVFGQVKDGMEVVDAIANVQRGAADVPVEPVTGSVEVGK